MSDLTKYLEMVLKGSKAVAVLCIGSEFRQDDAAGTIVFSRLQKKLKTSSLRRRIKVFNGATAPENLTGEIKSFRPSVIILIDSAEIGKAPGTILVLDPQEMGESVTFSTHKMPAKVLIDYFLSSLRCRVLLIGIQPAGLTFGKKPSAKVRSAAGYVATTIIGAIRATS